MQTFEKYDKIKHGKIIEKKSRAPKITTLVAFIVTGILLLVGGCLLLFLLWEFDIAAVIIGGIFAVIGVALLFCGIYLIIKCRKFLNFIKRLSQNGKIAAATIVLVDNIEQGSVLMAAPMNSAVNNYRRNTNILRLKYEFVDDGANNREGFGVLDANKIDIGVHSLLNINLLIGRQMLIVFNEENSVILRLLRGSKAEE